MASPFSFHCMICFEEFEIDVRYPVVLPCGHTYVCNLCAERLERCMECRTSLSIAIPRGSAENPQNQQQRAPTSRYSRTTHSRHSHDQHPRTTPQPPIRKRLPLPKNVVLLSLIEATELATEDVHEGHEEPQLTDSPSVKTIASVVDDEEHEEAKIRAGTSLTISDCGTYAVAASEGLEIYPSRPAAEPTNSQEESQDADVDTLVRFFHMDNKLDYDHEDGSNPDNALKESPPVQLRCGDRVQIVSTDSGWAKLARGYGFVRADCNQLLKVGGSVDRACKLEALLRHMSKRRKQLRTEQMRIDNHFIALMNELQVSLMSDEDLTVIPADTFTSGQQTSKSPLQAEVRDNESSGHPRGGDERAVGEDSTPLKPRTLERPVTPPTDVTRGFFCSGTDVLDNMMARSSALSQHPFPSPPRSPALLEAFSQTFRTHTDHGSAPLFPFASHPSPSALKAGARAWREMHGRPASANAGIDFRTGLSGHMALLSSHAHPHDMLETSTPARPAPTFRGMSNHTGLTMWKPFRRTGSNSLGVPSFSGSPAHDDSSTVEPTTPTDD